MNRLGKIILWPVSGLFDLLADIVSDLTPPRHVEGCGFTFNAPGPNSQQKDLGPNQLAWLDAHFAPFNGFAVMRRQAEASKQ